MIKTLDHLIVAVSDIDEAEKNQTCYKRFHSKSQSKVDKIVKSSIITTWTEIIKQVKVIV